MEIAQQLKAGVSLVENLCLVKSTYIVVHNYLQL